MIMLIAFLVQALGFAIFARAILSWFPIDKNGPVVQALNAITDPILDPLRRVIPPLGAIDLTPMIAIIVLFTISQILFEGA
jgi:YggT family protein